mmetsp:Transcript_12645/g.22344  ORF Transcript_12645/g.22344 Transcript_12645/m.22344 type:complete len:243 (-) Transcript_12645:937-1665(-)
MLIVYLVLIFLFDLLNLLPHFCAQIQFGIIQCSSHRTLRSLAQVTKLIVQVKLDPISVLGHLTVNGLVSCFLHLGQCGLCSVAVSFCSLHLVEGLLKGCSRCIDGLSLPWHSVYRSRARPPSFARFSSPMLSFQRSLPRLLAWLTATTTSSTTPVVSLSHATSTTSSTSISAIPAISAFPVITASLSIASTTFPPRASMPSISSSISALPVISRWSPAVTSWRPGSISAVSGRWTSLPLLTG